jgi:hypothetical protein
MISSLRIFAKSLHWLAAGWAVAIVWLCYAQIQRGLLFDPVVNYHLETLAAGVIPALVIEVAALASIALMGSAPSRELQRREWLYAFVWSLFPNLMILYTVHLMVIGDL